MASIHFRVGDRSLGSRDLNWGVTRIGRARDNDLVIDHPSVSTHHCELVLGLDSLVVRDCASTNGTFVDGKAVRESELHPGQVLRFGEIEGRLEYSEDRVSVPELPLPKRKKSVALDDGTVSCLNHPNVRATRRCSRCKQMFCDSCIHHLSFRSGPGVEHNFCPQCSADTELIVWEQGKEKKKSVWALIKGVFGGRKT
jgi:pSer/pThr/pTyr-binding forkhead associated (FHA) protein